ncbi:MAG: DUF371 domain-containing protein [Promethearchaeota archaeon]|nr:MAG: DUF371 domain-containing protein [Candidatus Lokiarchaeota archaeon]
MILEEIYAFGHNYILCTHNTTIEITKEKNLTKKGNCILGINSSKACSDLNQNLKSQLNQGKKFKIILKVRDQIDHFYGYGHSNLTLLDKRDMVFRKSKFICDRTVLINCTKSASELNRKLIGYLKNKDEKLSILFEKLEEDEE